LNEHPAVRECVVTAHQDRSNDKQLAAYFVSAALAPPAPEELRQHLRQTLPEYMVPATFVAMTSLPLNANGKMDRNALPPPEHPMGETARQFTVPRDDLEAQLTKIWEDVLGIQPIGVEDHFFDMGGHSLLAVRLVARIEKAFRKKIPVATIFQSPTIAQLAAALREEKAANASSSLVEIQPKGSKPPLFLVHGVGGGMFWGYTNLSRHLGPDQPVYAFKSRGMDGQEEFGSIEEMATHYVADLRGFQPRGPYYLGGYCFGGNVAYEMARQLQTQGEKVALLALMNCAPPNSSYNRIRITPAFCFKFVKNFGHWARYVLQLKREQQRDLILWKLRAIAKKFLRIFSHSRGASADIDVEEVVNLTARPEDGRHLWAVHVRALLKHRAQPYAGHVTLFRTCGHSLVCSFDNACGWRELAAGGVSVRIVPGAHESILDEPPVRVVADHLKQRLQSTVRQDPETKPL